MIPTIKYATTKDIPEIVDLWEKMVYELTGPDATPNKEWWAAQAIKLLEMQSIYEILVAKQGKRIIGFIDYFIYPEPATGMLHGVGQHFYVTPEHRGSNIASRLYRKTLTVMKKKSVDVMELFCFDSEKDMWQRKGFMPRRTLMRRYTHV